MKHVRDSKLAEGRGGWTAWIKECDIPERTAQKFIQVFTQFGNTSQATALPTGKLFELIALPDSVDRLEFIQQSHTIPSTSETKTVDEMTVKELREVKKALKEQQTLAQQAKSVVDSGNRDKITFAACLVPMLKYFFSFIIVRG